MRGWRWLGFCAALVLTALWPAGRAFAVSVSGQASTEVEWYDTGAKDTAVPGSEYLLLNMQDLDGNGLSFAGYGRLSYDFARTKGDVVDSQSRLYYAYLEKKGLIDGLDVRLGRQFVATTAGASLMDGLYLDYKNLGPVGIKVFGGGDVSYYSGYNAQQLVDGMEVYGHFLDTLSLGVSYLQKWDHSEMANELFGFNASYDYDHALNIYNETQFNYLSNTISYFLTGVQYHRSSRWDLRTEYLYSLPVFSSTSIYSVFAVDEYRQLMAEFNYHINLGLHSFVRYTHEFYKDTPDADVYEAGIEKIRTDRFSGYLSGVWRIDKGGQNMRGFKVNAAYLFTNILQAGIGADVDVLQRWLDTDTDMTTSSDIWVDVTAYLSRKMTLEAKVERVKSDLWDHYYRGRVRLNVRF